MFSASPPASPLARCDLRLTRAVRAAFPGPAEFLSEPGHRAQVAEYLTDLARTGGRELSADPLAGSPAAQLSHSYGEMAHALIGSAVRPDEPVDLLILAFSVHDLRPGRQTAAYLSHVTPGSPMAFAVCDQGSAAAFSALRLARGYRASARVRRALVIVVEQAALPYHCPVPLPARHQGVAMLFGDDPVPRARVTRVRQQPGVPPDEAAAVAAGYLAELAADRADVALVVSESLAALWTTPDAARVRVAPAGQPATGVWWGLLDELPGGPDGDGQPSRPGQPELLVVADYDAELRYLCLTALDTRVPG